MEWSQLIEEYLGTKHRLKKEYEPLKNLLQGRVLEEVNREMGSVTLEDLLKYQSVRNRIYSCCETVLMLETRSKAKAAERLKGFGSYLKKNYQVDLSLDENLPEFFEEKTPRQVDLLKTLHTTSEIRELEERYNLSPKPLRAELEALVEGRELLGQKVKIERVVTPRGEVKLGQEKFL